MQHNELTIRSTLDRACPYWRAEELGDAIAVHWNKAATQIDRRTYSMAITGGWRGYLISENIWTATHKEQALAQCAAIASIIILNRKGL